MPKIKFKATYVVKPATDTTPEFKAAELETYHHPAGDFKDGSEKEILNVEDAEHTNFVTPQEALRLATTFPKNFELVGTDTKKLKEIAAPALNKAAGAPAFTK